MHAAATTRACARMCRQMVAQDYKPLRQPVRSRPPRCVGDAIVQWARGPSLATISGPFVSTSARALSVPDVRLDVSQLELTDGSTQLLGLIHQRRRRIR